MQYHKLVFAHPIWLWGILLIPLLWLGFKFYRHKIMSNQPLIAFADPELLPHLIHKISTKKTTFSIIHIWCLLWLLGMLAMAGPRYRFIEYETYKPDAALMIMLDLSQSMRAEDLKPNRIIQAKQQIEDILKLAKSIRIGLIGFAKFAHLITPITDDFSTIQHLLPAVDVDLITKQGINLSAALNLAIKSLQAEPGNSKHILIISDGNFIADDINATKKISQDGICIHAIGIGTEQGAPYKDKTGSWVKINNKVVIAKLNADILKYIVQIGKGRYWQASYNEQELTRFIRQITQNGNNKINTTGKIKQWEESFFWLLFPMLILALLLRRKHIQFNILVFSVLLGMPQPSTALDWFKNSEQQGEQYYKNGDYEKAAVTFTDPYRQGVALYKAGKFAAAEQAFKNSSRVEVAIDAQYNLGNAQLKQGKYKLAIDTYRSVLQKAPEHEAAKINLKIAKKLFKKEKKAKIDKSCGCNNGKNQPDTKQSEQPASNKNNNADATNKTNDDSNTQNSADVKNDNGNDKKNIKATSNNAQQPNSENTENSIEKNNQLEQNNAKSKSKNNDYAAEQSAVAGSPDKQASEDTATEILLKQLNNDIKFFLRNKFLIEENK